LVVARQRNPLAKLLSTRSELCFLWVVGLAIFGIGVFEYGGRLENLKIKNAKKRERKPDLSFFAQKNLENTFALAAEKGVKIVFLYLPTYQTQSEKLLNFLNFYKQHGEVWIPPTAILENTDFWLDEGHLNDAGADAFALWLADQLHLFQNQHNSIF
jgi:hypothetical protein